MYREFEGKLTSEVRHAVGAVEASVADLEWQRLVESFRQKEMALRKTRDSAKSIRLMRADFGQLLLAFRERQLGALERAWDAAENGVKYDLVSVVAKLSSPGRPAGAADAKLELWELSCDGTKPRHLSFEKRRPDQAPMDGPFACSATNVHDPVWSLDCSAKELELHFSMGEGYAGMFPAEAKPPVSCRLAVVDAR